ncbi:MAG: hypothetical protein R3E14_08685 [Erythrobacter sp.]
MQPFRFGALGTPNFTRILDEQIQLLEQMMPFIRANSYGSQKWLTSLQPNHPDGHIDPTNRRSNRTVGLAAEEQKTGREAAGNGKEHNLSVFGQ